MHEQKLSDHDTSRSVDDTTVCDTSVDDAYTETTSTTRAPESTIQGGGASTSG